MSRVPNGHEDFEIASMAFCSLPARITPRVWIPTSARPAVPLFFSKISWAILAIERSMDWESRTSLFMDIKIPTLFSKMWV